VLAIALAPGLMVTAMASDFATTKELAGQGDIEAQYNLGNLYSKGEGGIHQNYTKALEWYLKAANQGYANAQSSLGV